MRLLPDIDPNDPDAQNRRDCFLRHFRLLAAYALFITIAFFVALLV